MFLSTNSLFEKKKKIGQATMDLFISDLNTKLKIVSRGVPGLVTDSACGVWAVDEPLVSCVVVQF